MASTGSNVQLSLHKSEQARTLCVEAGETACWQCRRVVDSLSADGSSLNPARPGPLTSSPALCSCDHLAESLRKHAGAIAAHGVTVDSSVTLPCGDVAWVAQHKVTKQRCVWVWKGMGSDWGRGRGYWRGRTQNSGWWCWVLERHGE
jgi:hypothetical protein